MTTILILGAAVWANGPSPTLRRRTAHAAALWQTMPAARLIPCGGLGRHPPTEAAAMQALLIAQGVPPSQITPEDRSTNTLENIRNGARLAWGDDLIIVTDPYHARRALLVARHFGLTARADCPAPLPGQARQRWRDRLALVGYWLRLLAVSRDLDGR